jgi:hypothetical protein
MKTTTEKLAITEHEYEMMVLAFLLRWCEA